MGTGHPNELVGSSHFCREEDEEGEREEKSLSLEAPR